MQSLYKQSMSNAVNVCGCRLLKDTEPAVWHSYALFAARSGKLGRAEEALRKAVALPSTSTDH